MDINKDLVAASATALILAILAEGDSYGYAILKRVSELSGGELQWTDGMLYPVLHRLERLGHIEGKWGPSETGRKRKYYRITARGQAQLAEQCQQWQMVDTALRNIWLAVSIPDPVCALAAAVPWLSPRGKRGSTTRSRSRSRNGGVPSPPPGDPPHGRGGAGGPPARPDRDAARRGPVGRRGFLVAIKRMGAQDAISNEFAREHSERLWKQLIIASTATPQPSGAARTETIVVFALAVPQRWR